MKKVIFLALSCLSACSKSVLVVPVDESNQPLSQAEILVDSNQLHQGATRIELTQSESHEVLVRFAPEYLPHALRIDSTSDHEIRVVLRKDASFAETISANEVEISPNQWFTVAISDSYALRNEWWRILIDKLVSHDFQLGLLDERSGYLTTHWKETTYPSVEGANPHTVRRRIRGTIASSLPLVYRMRIDVEHQLPGTTTFSSWDRLYREDLGFLREFIALMERPERVM